MQVNDICLVNESISLEKLIVGPNGRLSAPEGKLLTVVVGGVEIDPAPGEYTGDIRLVITDYIDAPIEGMHARPGDPPEPYRAALLLEKDGPSENSVSAAYAGGTIEGSTVSGGTSFPRSMT